MKLRIWMLLACAGVLWGEKLAPAERGVPADLGGDARLEQRGAQLYLSARLPEPGGKVLARSIGRNPVWEKDAIASPEVEDRVRWRIRYKSAAGLPRELVIEGNPWGAYRTEEGGQVIGDIGLVPSAEVTVEGWRFEALVPLARLDLAANTAALEWRAERIRSRRALAPEFRWQTGSGFAALPLARNAGGAPPALRPPAFGNTAPPLEIGRVLRVPAVAAKWDDPAWAGVPAFELPGNAPYPHSPRHGTRIKWNHDGRTLALLARMEEPEPVVARAGGRDAAITGDDHLAVYLATSGSAFLEIVVNSVGAIRDSRGAGPRIGVPRANWNAEIETETDVRYGHWVLRLNIPLEQCAAALGETGVPEQWRVLVVRHRAARPGEAAEWSTLPVMQGKTSFNAPVRYQAMVLRNADPARVKLPEAVRAPAAPDELARALRSLDAQVWPASYRRRHAVRGMVQDHLRRKVEQAVLAEREAWEKVRSRQDWERFRDERIAALKQSSGRFPPEKPALAAQVTGRHSGNGYRLENVVYQVRPQHWMTANLYLPEKAAQPVPAIVIVHSQHYPKIQGELHDMGEIWARAGAAVLVTERAGFGERIETLPWFRQAYASRHNFSKLLFPAGENYSGWLAWDVVRSVDFLYERPEIDRSRIILLGSVAGGGEIAGVAAALDPRIAAVAPYNYDQGHVRVHGDTPGQIARQFSPWLVSASIAPRKFIRAFEFGWEGAEEPDYPSLWVDGMERSRKVWDFYNAAGNLAGAQAYGLIRLSMERASHCFSIGPQQREELYPAFQKWFGIPYPSKSDLAILPDSDLSTNPIREEARRQEALRRRPHTELVSIPPAANAELKRKPLHEIAGGAAVQDLEAARARRRALRPAEQAAQLRKELRPRLGDIEPAVQPRAQAFGTRTAGGMQVEALSLAVEDRVAVPLLLIRPPGAAAAPVVVAVAQEGKERLLAHRASEIQALLRAGIAVCLPDVRATGETAPAWDRADGGAYQRLAQTEFDLGGSLLGSRLKDLRTVMAYLRGRSDIDAKRIAVWGDSLAPPNPANLWLDEVENEGGPQPQMRSEPMGAHLALLAALYEDNVRAVAARGGLSGYLSILDSAFAYVPVEDIIYGVLKTGDVADIAAGIAPRPLLLEGMVNGRNIRVEEAALGRVLEPARAAYKDAGAAGSLTLRAEPRDAAAWLASHLR